MRCQIAPSVLSFNQADMATPVSELFEAGVDWIHFDVMDGQFVPPITFGDALVWGLRPLGDTPFEVHLMTNTPERHFEAFAEAGCQRIIFHQEAATHSHRLAEALRSMGLQSGIAVCPGTSIETIYPVLDVVDLVLVMTVNPGYGGQTLIRSCLDKVRALRKLAPDLDIEVDGGIDALNLPDAVEAGANVFVVGSFLLRAPSIGEAVKELRARCG